MKISLQSYYTYFLIIVFLSYFFPTITQAQNRSQIDSLKTLLHKSDNNERLDLLFELGSNYKFISLDTALIYYQEALVLAREIKDEKTEGQILKNIAQSYFFKSNYQTALEYLFSSLDIIEGTGDTLELININYGIAIVYFARGQEDLSFKYNQTAFTLATKSNNKERIAATSDLSGDLYIEIDKDYEKALEVYFQSYNYYDSTGNERELAVTASKLGGTFSMMGKYEGALEYLDQAYELARKYNIKNAIYGTMVELGVNYFAAGKYVKAEKILELCVEQTRTEYKRFCILSLDLLAKIDSAQGDFKGAYNNLLQYHNLNDSLLNINSQEKLAEVEAKYQNEKKQAQIELLEKDNEIQTLWRNSFIGAFIFAFILAGGLYNRYRYKNKTSKELANLNNQLEGELKQAAEYIESLLPPKLEDKVETDWKFIPSAHLGGDSFGYNYLDENHFAFYLIDVSGHGVGAALLSTSVLNIIKSKSLPNTDFYNPAEVLNNLNKSFNMEEHDDKYFALWYGVINTATKELVCASAFHPPAVAISKGNICKYGKKEMMIGAFDDYKYENAYYQLSTGDSLFLFSDGCFEIETENKELTFDDFTNLLKTADKENGKTLDFVYSSLNTIKNSNMFDDDFSIINIKLN